MGSACHVWSIIQSHTLLQELAGSLPPPASFRVDLLQPCFSSPWHSRSTLAFSSACEAKN